MDLSKFMPKYKDDTDTGGSEEETLSPFEYHQKYAPKHGPSKSRPFTNGQIRRMITRQRATEKRKANLRHRRTFLANQQGTAVLRGQLQAVTALPLSDGTYADIDHPSVPAIIRALTETYGSVSEATEIYGRVLADSE